MIDVDEIRDTQIAMHNLNKADEKYTFFHDETNNIKKLRIGNKGFNVADLNTFVLGGVVCEGAVRDFDLSSLRSDMRIQESASEIKLKHVAKGDFLQLLQPEKLTIFLDWLSGNELYIHYNALDPLYWSLVDIIDSIVAGVGDSRLFEYHLLLKADLVSYLRTNLPRTISLLHQYNYPDLPPENRRDFLNGLLDILEQSDHDLEEFNAMILKGVLQSGRDLLSLDFIEGFTPHLTIESFTPFYLNRVTIFKHSNHILDMEDSVQSELDALPLVSEGHPFKNYRFADSKLEPGIQIADVIVGLIGKMFTYFANTSEGEIEAARHSLNGTSLKNAEQLRDLIDTSHNANIAFLNNVMSIYELNKMNLFLQNQANV